MKPFLDPRLALQLQTDDCQLLLTRYFSIFYLACIAYFRLMLPMLRFVADGVFFVQKG